MPSKPLKFLYSKYASQAQAAPENVTAPHTAVANGLPALLNAKGDQLVTSAVTEAQLRRLGREFTELERIHKFFSAGRGHQGGTSYVASSSGSADSRQLSGASRRARDLHGSPVRFRSKSQEFQSKYRLAASRISPEHRHAPFLQIPTETPDNSHGPLPRLPVKGTPEITGALDGNGKVMEITLQTKTSLRKSVLPAKGQASHFHVTPDPQVADDCVSCSSFRTVELMHRDSPVQDACVTRLPVAKLPRCQSRSPVDQDRLDSCHYQYLLHDFSSSSSSSLCKSVQSDPASTQFSARAYRPSTTRTNSTNRRLRELTTSGTEVTAAVVGPAKARSRHNSTSLTARSPDSQWPPRYAVIPSWPSLEDVQTLRTCGPHQGLLTQLYRKESRWSRDGNAAIVARGSHVSVGYPHLRQPVHVVPSHTSTECAMCNLYCNHPDPTACPPNSPLVNRRRDYQDPRDPYSRLSNNYSVVVNYGTPTTPAATVAYTAPSTSSSKQQRQHHHRHTPSSPPSRNSWQPSANQKGRRISGASSDSNSWPANRGVGAGRDGKGVTKSVSFSSKVKRELPFSWDTCHMTCIQARV